MFRVDFTHPKHEPVQRERTNRRLRGRGVGLSQKIHEPVRVHSHDNSKLQNVHGEQNAAIVAFILQDD
jgi:hypothetical protein